MRLTTTQIKILTSVVMLICLAFLILWIVSVGERPGPTAPRAENKAYAIRLLTYFGVAVLFLILSAAGAIVIMRRAAAEYRAAQMDNMKDLIEATLLDQKKVDE